MDPKVMEMRIKQWIPMFEEQAKSGLNKQEWCIQNGINRSAFFKWQRECRKYLLTKQGPNLPSIDGGSATQEFVEITCQKENPVYDWSSQSCSPQASEIVLTMGGISISLKGNIDENNLTKVLKAISYVNR